ncbi:TGRM2 protein, partial [Rhinopomastus cyanomelas]|nr:TGRM2 protein [Rhinopomastus cyanomelas]
PHQELLSALTWLSSSDWEQKFRGLFNVGCLATYHSDVLLSKLHAVSLAVTKEVNNLRSRVSCFAMSTLGKLCSTMKKGMDLQVDEITRVLLQKSGDSHDFIQKTASRCLGVVVESVTPARAMSALMANGVQHRNILVRKCAAEHLLTVVEKIGAKKLLSGKWGSTDLLVQTLVKLAQDSCPDTRCYGRRMLYVLMSHRDFDRYLKKTSPSHDL